MPFRINDNGEKTNQRNIQTNCPLQVRLLNKIARYLFEELVYKRTKLHLISIKATLLKELAEAKKEQRDLLKERRELLGKRIAQQNIIIAQRNKELALKDKIIAKNKKNNAYIKKSAALLKELAALKEKQIELLKNENQFLENAVDEYSKDNERRSREIHQKIANFQENERVRKAAFMYQFCNFLDCCTLAPYKVAVYVLGMLGFRVKV
jgi:hypothetical protein